MATKLKSKAQALSCETIEAAQAAIKRIGDLQREQQRVEGEANDAIASITEQAAQALNPVRDEIALLQDAVQTYCEANREKLCGKGKSANLITGEVSWRQRPPSVSVRGADKVLALLLKKGLERFIRTKDEVNKEAVLAEPDAVAGVAGITVITGVEDFAITPFEVTVAA